MTTFRLALLSLLATGCFSGTTSTDTSGTDDTADTNDTQDTQDTETGDTQEQMDTGTAYVSLHLRGGPDGNAKWGYAAWDKYGTGDVVCEMYADLTQSAEATDCANCDYAFETTVTGGATEGAGCDTLLDPATLAPLATFTDYTYKDLQMLGNYDGFGFSAAYTMYYEGYGEFEWTDVAWLRSKKKGEWFTVARNLPAYDVYDVTTDGDNFDALRSFPDSTGTAAAYYYFFPL